MVNSKNLEGKTPEQQKDIFEIDLIADFEMECGESDNWSDEVRCEFDRRWNEIQRNFMVIIRGEARL